VEGGLEVDLISWRVSLAVNDANRLSSQASIVRHGAYRQISIRTRLESHNGVIFPLPLGATHNLMIIGLISVIHAPHEMIGSRPLPPLFFFVRRFFLFFLPRWEEVIRTAHCANVADILDDELSATWPEMKFSLALMKMSFCVESPGSQLCKPFDI
jgi:hypothetical protein